MDELEEIKQRKLEQLKKQYMYGGKNMVDNLPDTPLKITDADIENNIKKYETIVIDCWAPWCAPCRMVAPVIDALAKDHAGEIIFGKLNVDENREVAVKYEIMSIPTLLVFKDGALVKRIVGAVPRQHIEQVIEENK